MTIRFMTRKVIVPRRIVQVGRRGLVELESFQKISAEGRRSSRCLESHWVKIYLGTCQLEGLLVVRGQFENVQSFAKKSEFER
jgi:hypothetical protein